MGSRMLVYKVVYPLLLVNMGLEQSTYGKLILREA